MNNDQSLYVEKVLDLYLRLPETPSRTSRYDRQLAAQLYQQQVAIEIIEAALLLASVRRLYRDDSQPRLGPIRSLHYFLPVIEEVSVNKLPPTYVQYLQYKLTSHPDHDNTSK